MPKNVSDAATFYAAIRFNAATTADEQRTHLDVLEGIEHDWLRLLAAKGIKGNKKERFLIWNGALLGYLMALKAVKRTGDATLAAEGRLREN